jgi:hypothetical protein
MAHYTTISADGDATIREAKYVYGQSSTVIVESNLDTAAVIIGYADQTGAFAAFPSGTLSGSGGLVNHNAMAHGGVTLMARVSGISTNPVVIKVTP